MKKYRFVLENKNDGSMSLSSARYKTPATALREARKIAKVMSLGTGGKKPVVASVHLGKLMSPIRTYRERNRVATILIGGSAKERGLLR